MPVPEQPPPDHPAKMVPAAATAFRSINLLKSYRSLQSVPQIIPDGVEVTVPLAAAVPVLVTVRTPHSGEVWPPIFNISFILEQ